MRIEGMKFCAQDPYLSDKAILVASGGSQSFGVRV